MVEYYITTETTCDLPDNYAEKFVQNPLTYTINDIHYTCKNGDNLDPKGFYHKIREGAMPTTSLVSPATAKDSMENILKQGYDVLHIAFSSALSGTCQSANIAAKELREEYPDRKIIVIDSLSASLGQGLLVDIALKKRSEGATIEELANYIENIKLKVCHYFTVDDLFHLYRGGRVKKSSAIIGQIVKIKPLLHVDNNGKLIPVGKIFTRKLALKWLVDKLEERYDKDVMSKIFISHGDCLEDALKVANRIKSNLGYDVEIINYIGPSIGAHSGPDTVALFFVGSERNENHE